MGPKKLGEIVTETNTLRLKSAFYKNDTKRNPMIEAFVNIFLDEDKLFPF